MGGLEVFSIVTTPVSFVDVVPRSKRRYNKQTYLSMLDST